MPVYYLPISTWSSSTNSTTTTSSYWSFSSSPTAATTIIPMPTNGTGTMWSHDQRSAAYPSE